LSAQKVLRLIIDVIFLGKRLLYYTKDDESKMVNSIDLTNARLEEIPYNREEPERYMFEITTVGEL